MSKMKVIKFEQDGCGPCRNVGTFLHTSLEFEDYETVNLSHVKNREEIEKKYGIMSVPVLYVEDDNGEEVGRVLGFNPPEIDKLLTNADLR